MNISNSPNNKSAIVTTKEHTNATRIELTLKNDQSQNTQSFQIKDIYTALIAAVSAIGGGVIGAYATYRYGEEIEKGKDRREKNKEKAFNERIKNLIVYEVNTYSSSLHFLLNNSHPIDIKRPEGTIQVNTSDLSSVKFRLQSHTKHYAQLTTERKAQVFNSDASIKIESAYEAFREFLQQLENQVTVT